MTQQLKSDWIAALQSGTYTEGKAGLKRNDAVSGITEYSALGVLCDLLDQQGTIQAAWGIQPPVGYSEFEYIDSNQLSMSIGTIPDLLKPVIGLTNQDITNIHTMSKILNQDFLTISNWIDQNL